MVETGMLVQVNQSHMHNVPPFFPSPQNTLSTSSLLAMICNLNLLLTNGKHPPYQSDIGKIATISPIPLLSQPLVPLLLLETKMKAQIQYLDI
jgi:hypothetical protein